MAVPLLATAVALVSLVGGGAAVAEDTPTSTPAATPTPAAVDGLVFEFSCSPGVFRPRAATVVECVTRYSNQGEEVRPAGRAELIPARSGPVIQYTLVWMEVNGERVPVDAHQTVFPGQELAPGETVEVRTVVVMTAQAEGVSESELRVISADGQVITSVPIVYTVTEEAADPPTGLSMESTVGLRGSESSYVLTVTNRSAEEVNALTLTLRYENASLLDAEPAALVDDASQQLVSWDLASFGRQSLAPGESLELRTSLALDVAGCRTARVIAVAEAATGEDTQRYGLGPQDISPLASCAPPPPPTPTTPEPRAEETPEAESAMSPPATGTSIGSSGGTEVWFLVAAAVGVAGCGVGLAMRRRSRV